MAERQAILAVVPPDPSAHIRASELQRGRLQRDRDDLAAGKGRYRDHPVAHAIWELHQAEVNMARLARSLAGSRTSRTIRKVWRSELADCRSNSAAAARAVEELSAPELARIDTKERELDQRLSGLWEQRETHHRWAADHPESSRRLDQLAAHIDALDGRLDYSRLAHDRARVVEPRGVVLDRGHGVDL